MAKSSRPKDSLPDSGADELERFFGPRKDTPPKERWPYPYESDVFYLWDWGQRISARAQKDKPINGFDPGYFRPDIGSQDALQRLSISYPEPIKQIREQLDGANAHFERALAGDERAADAFWGYLSHLEMRINAACRTIHGAQSNLTLPQTIASADKIADNSKLFSAGFPDNPELKMLACELDLERSKPANARRSDKAIANDKYPNGDSLLRELRRQRDKGTYHPAE